ncbi:unnamed protein product [Hymenolepis diminuta]|uniref:Uncharacterized protein n=1 Tax=Hymenolepis diminuta TaxID=6216 RepID=A0A564Y9T6_HYMDI|nr:unnamed protein product [Hymenolepis diminuta]
MNSSKRDKGADVYMKNVSVITASILVMRKGEDIHKYTAFVNRVRNAFLYGSPKKDQFRCLVIVRGLCSPLYTEIHMKLLSLLDEKPDIMLHHLVHDDSNFWSLNGPLEHG